jgi:hypothetical protein
VKIVVVLELVSFSQALDSSPSDSNVALVLSVAFLSSTIPGATREPDTESEDETLQGKALRIPSKKKASASTPQLAGMR